MALAIIAPAVQGHCMVRTDTGNALLSERVRSLQAFGPGQQYAVGMPVMLLGGEEGVRIEFDVLGDDRDYLRYEIVHCNADWQPSQLAYVEYLDGFNEGTVDNYSFSQATNVHYVHYVINIPDGQMRPLVSGNYLVRVYDESDGPEHPMMQCRFAVSEETASVGGAITGRTDIDYNKAHQQLSLEVDTRRANIRDIFNDITVVIEQNSRADNRVTLGKPLRVSGTTAVYEHDPRLIFKGGNEYRRFETVSTRFPGMHVSGIEWHSPYYHAFIEPDRTRTGESYHYDETLSGAFVIREYNADERDSNTLADYLVTHFCLDYPETPGFDIFIDGDFVQRRLSPDSRMVYNRATGMYELTLLLKQGAYSYQYLAVPKGGDTGRTDVIEGDKYETRNRYTVYVYHRRPGERYDRLIAVKQFF